MSNLVTPWHEAGRRGVVAPGLERHLVEQRYEEYDESAHAVWSEVLRRNEELCAEHGARMHPAYVAGMRALELQRRIPRVEEINERLSPTGWRIVSVDGYIPTKAYVALMASRVFPVSRVIRRREHIDFAPAPDMVHDILGHLPLLFAPELRDYLARLASVMSRARPNALDTAFFDAVRHMSELKSRLDAPAAEVQAAEVAVDAINRALSDEASELTRARRIYVWSIEFGMTGDPLRPTIHGAALLSSPAEFRAVCSGAPRLRPYCLDVVAYENAFSDVLDGYFVARDFSHLNEVLSAFEATMLAGERRDRNVQPAGGREGGSDA